MRIALDSTSLKETKLRDSAQSKAPLLTIVRVMAETQLVPSRAASEKTKEIILRFLYPRAWSHGVFITQAPLKER